ncbi:storkhead-box protein 2-like [Oncorhynchus masou masou]|uniref:storkhead-box protein 2-like n=1 Tax=Oncorhynchus masou masou TaxID=90313 RepID=UPI0031845558
MFCVPTPTAEILHHTLSMLVRERKIYPTPEGYFIVMPQTYFITPSLIRTSSKWYHLDERLPDRKQQQQCTSPSLETSSPPPLAVSGTGPILRTMETFIMITVITPPATIPPSPGSPPRSTGRPNHPEVWPLQGEETPMAMPHNVETEIIRRINPDLTVENVARHTAVMKRLEEESAQRSKASSSAQRSSHSRRSRRHRKPQGKPSCSHIKTRTTRGDPFEGSNLDMVAEWDSHPYSSSSLEHSHARHLAHSNPNIMESHLPITPEWDVSGELAKRRTEMPFPEPSHGPSHGPSHSKVYHSHTRERKSRNERSTNKAKEPFLFPLGWLVPFPRQHSSTLLSHSPGLQMEAVTRSTSTFQWVTWSSWNTRENLASNTSSIVESNRRPNLALSPGHLGITTGNGPPFTFQTIPELLTTQPEKLQKPSNCLASITSV